MTVPEPAITTAAKWKGGHQAAVRRVVIHTTEPPLTFPAASQLGQARAVARYFASGSGGRKASAHYVVDVGQVEHCVPEHTIAFHAPPNAGSVGIELCARAIYTPTQWRSATIAPMLDRAARLTADVCKRLGVPVVKLDWPAVKQGRSGICGHVDVSNAYHQTDHTDPGGSFPWAEFIAAVQRYHEGNPTMPITDKDADKIATRTAAATLPRIVAERAERGIPWYLEDGTRIPSFEAASQLIFLGLARWNDGLPFVVPQPALAVIIARH